MLKQQLWVNSAKLFKICPQKKVGIYLLHIMIIDTQKKIKLFILLIPMQNFNLNQPYLRYEFVRTVVDISAIKLQWN